MARYFFRVAPDGPYDAEGEELADDAAAAKMATLVIQDMVRNHPGWGDRRLTVFDASGRLVAERALSDEAAPIGSVVSLHPNGSR